MGILLAVLTAIIVFSGYLLFDKITNDKKRQDALRTRIAPDGSHVLNQDEPFAHLSGEPSPAIASLASLMRGLGVNVDELVHKLERRFAQAGINSPDAPILYLFFQRIVALGLLIFGLILFTSAQGETGTLTKMIGAFIIIGGVFGPKLYLQNLIDRRKKILQRAFPDTLDLLLICVESGLALDASLNRVCNELGYACPEMTAELNRTRLELSLINDRVRALTNLSERTGMVAFRALTSALIQSERFGTSLTDTLRVLSDEFRIQRLTDAEINAARLPVLMTVPLIFLLMPAFFIIVLGPAVIRIMQDGTEITGK
jgi:tight adherence protein C